jgi:hypothetical protein
MELLEEEGQGVDNLHCARSIAFGGLLEDQEWFQNKPDTHHWWSFWESLHCSIP